MFGVVHFRFGFGFRLKCLTCNMCMSTGRKSLFFPHCVWVFSIIEILHEFTTGFCSSDIVCLSSITEIGISRELTDMFLSCYRVLLLFFGQDPKRAMREAFLSLDEKFLALAGERDWYSGSTVLVALMRGR